MKWSKLKQIAEGLLDPDAGIKLKCTVYRSLPGSGNPGVGRFWIMMDGDIIWDIPKQLPKTDTGVTQSPYEGFLPSAIGLLREYINTPVAELPLLRWPDSPKDLPEKKRRDWTRTDCQGAYYSRARDITNSLLEIMMMADRRVGQKRKRAMAQASSATKRIWQKMNHQM